mmetsp:Transcript_1930/g.4343  ORF Transcript_1930/g.4343 Transcript_1930/m.4343 type:complete len:323 (+) Transcript_1930:326-1294(+)
MDSLSTFRERDLVRTPSSPQLAEHCDQGSHSSQKHRYVWTTQSPQAVTSFWEPWQPAPPFASCLAIPRVLNFSSFASHSLHSVHSVHSQLTRSAKQGTSGLHRFVSCSEDSQFAPWRLGKAFTSRLRFLKPTWQVAEHSVHSDHSDSWQSSLSASSSSVIAQPSGTSSPSAGLHGASFAVGPLHLPWSPAGTLILLTISTCPKHFAEHSWSFLIFQLPNSQSRVSEPSQSKTWQAPYSSAEPCAGVPHQVSSRARARVRLLVPVPHVAVHPDHSPQSAHSPSMQHLGCPPQFSTGITSSLILGGHCRPPPEGNREMSRFRNL